MIKLRLIAENCRALRRLAAAGQVSGLLATLLITHPGYALELNSERIERRFGSYGLSVLEERPALRISNLYSTDASGATCRTLATVLFLTPLPDALAGVHRRVLDGGSIGATFKASGWQVLKTHRYLGTIDVPTNADRLKILMRVDPSGPLALHVYDLEVARNGERYPYATLIEAHHPDYLSPAALQSIYRDEPRRPLSADGLARLKQLTRDTLRGKLR